MVEKSTATIEGLPRKKEFFATKTPEHQNPSKATIYCFYFGGIWCFCVLVAFLISDFYELILSLTHMRWRNNVQKLPETICF